MIRGSCLCGAIRFEVSRPLRYVTHCHCSMCRKSHGAAFATDGLVPLDEFRWLDGEHELAHFESSPGTYRCFCRICGSRVVMKPKGWTDKILVYLGVLDDDPVARPGGHIFVPERAPWFEITDALPCFERGLDGPRVR